MSMEYTYPPSNEVGRDDNQLCSQSAKETFVDDYRVCMIIHKQLPADIQYKTLRL